MYLRIFRAIEVLSDRDQYSDRSCPSDRHDPAESIGFRLCRNRERADGDPSLQSVSTFEAEALLGKSFLGAWILR